MSHDYYTRLAPGQSIRIGQTKIRVITIAGRVAKIRISPPANTLIVRDSELAEHPDDSPAQVAPHIWREVA